MNSHDLILFCLKFAGMISRTGGLLLKSYSFYIRTSYLIFGASLFMYMHLEPKPFKAKLQTVHYFIALAQIFCKFLSIVYNQRETLEIVNIITNLSEEALVDPKNKLVIERANRISRKITKFIMFGFCAYYPLRVANLLVRYYILRMPPQLFLQASWIPPALASRYVLGLLYQVSTSVCVGFTNASYNCFIIYLTIQISAQLQVLRRMFEETYPLGECVYLHRRLLSLFLRVNRLLAGLMSVEIVLSSFYGCVCSFLIIKSLSAGGREMANHIHVLLLVLLRLFLICFCGNVIMKQGEKLFSSAYFGSWYEQDKKHRSSLLFVLILSTVQPFKYNYRRIITMDMAQFMKSVQTMYSYLTMLLSFEDHK